MSTILRFKFKKFILIHILLFLIASLLGFLTGNLTRKIEKITFFNKSFSEYFLHNLTICLFIILIGIFTLGYFLWIFMLMNGYVLGSAIGMLNIEFQTVDIIYLFIHGIFELPALFLAVYIGKYISHLIVESIFRNSQLLQKRPIKIILFLLFIMVFLLLIASIIESLPKIGG
ncbi:stage II sporulation protein M [Staphylococcus delphini]|uniref:stage II sporulation protein M n=1 Tax=Staphylococcus delphini TaxID=53344 RepID=UPI0021D2E67D|nr:stage II sporulation protein M [Staphylococcus delphini]UXS21657.1 stage II sporulation protein M [Staphylococcus delphini]UXS57601.1 stage II sporulation protein M [Staphylococcus delphini]